MKRNWFIVRFLFPLLVLLGFCGCSLKRVEEPAVPTVFFPPAVEQPAKQSMVFLLSPDDTAERREAAEVFAEQVSALTDGQFTIELRQSADPLKDFRGGEGDLFFVDTLHTPMEEELLHFLSSPMLYKDYTTFTLALNAEKMLEMLGDGIRASTNMKPLAALYEGSSYLVAKRGVESVAVESERSEEPQEAERIAPRTNSNSVKFFLSCGLEPVVYDTFAERIDALHAGEVTYLEVTSAEADSISWENRDLTLLRTSHDLTPCWLMCGDRRYNRLPEQYQAVVQEALAYLFPLIDDRCQARESELIASIRERGGSSDRIASPLREVADRLIAEQTAADLEKKYLWGIIGSLA